MIQKKIAALALVALGLIGVSLAFTVAILHVSLPAGHQARLDGDILTNAFLGGFFGGVILIGFGAGWYERLLDAKYRPLNEKQNARNQKRQYA